MNGPKVVLHLTPKWSDAILVDPRREPLITVQREEVQKNLVVILSLPHPQRPHPIVLEFPCRVGEPLVSRDANNQVNGIQCWGLRKLGVTVWQVTPSIREESLDLHAYIVMCDVPDPAPFNASLIVVKEG